MPTREVERRGRRRADVLLRFPQAVPDDCPLTPREFEMVIATANGLSTAATAAQKGLSFSTVRTHLSHAYRKLGVYDRAQAVAVVGRFGWLDWERPPAPEPEPPLSAWERVYLAEFDQWLASRFHDTGARQRMRVALLGMRMR